MADSPVEKLENEILQFLQENKSTEYSTLVKAFVDRFKNKILALKNPAGATIVICGLSATSYRDKKKTVEGLNSFYLPDEVEMQVLGEVKLTPCSWMALLLVTCNDRRLYAYDDETEELHMIAQDLERLLHEGLEYPASLTYYKGEAFEKMTHEDWDKVKNSDFGKSLEQEHCELVMAKKGQMLESLGYKASGTEMEREIQNLRKEVQHLKVEIWCQDYRQGHAFRADLSWEIMILEREVEQYTKHIEDLRGCLSDAKKTEVSEQIRHSTEKVRHLTGEISDLNTRLEYCVRFDSSDSSDDDNQTSASWTKDTEPSTAAGDEATSSKPETKQPKIYRWLRSIKLQGRRTEKEREIEEQVKLLREHFEHLKRQLKYDSSDSSVDDNQTSASLIEETEQQKKIQPILFTGSSKFSSSVKSSGDLKLLKKRGGGPKKQVKTEGNISPPTLSRQSSLT